MDGTEVAVTVIEQDGAPVALPAVEIRPNSGIYDYTARYTAGGETRFIVPAELGDEVADACAELAIAAHRVLGLRDLSRSDIVASGRHPVFIEVNSAPGMTETSLLPQEVEAAGWDFGVLCGQLVDGAWARHVSERVGWACPCGSAHQQWLIAVQRDRPPPCWACGRCACSRTRRTSRPRTGRCSRRSRCLTT